MSYYKIENTLNGIDALGGTFGSQQYGGGSTTVKTGGENKKTGAGFNTGKSGGSGGNKKTGAGLNVAKTGSGKRTSSIAAAGAGGGGSIVDEPGFRQAVIKQALSRILSGINSGAITAFTVTQASIIAPPLVLSWKEAGASRSLNIPFDLIDQGIRNMVQTAKDAAARKAKAFVESTLPVSEKTVKWQEAFTAMQALPIAVEAGWVTDFVASVDAAGAYHVSWSKLSNGYKKPVAYRITERVPYTFKDLVARIKATQAARAGKKAADDVAKIQQDQKAIADKTLTKSQAIGILQGVRIRVQGGSVTDFAGVFSLVKDEKTQQMRSLLLISWTSTSGKKEDYRVFGADVQGEITNLVNTILSEQAAVAAAKAAAASAGASTTSGSGGPTATNELTALADELRAGIAAGNVTSVTSGLNMQSRLFVKWVDRGVGNSRLFSVAQSTPAMVALFASIAASVKSGGKSAGDIKTAIEETKNEIDKSTKEAQDKSSQGNSVAADAAISQVQALQAQLQNLQQELADALASQSRGGGSSSITGGWNSFNDGWGSGQGGGGMTVPWNDMTLNTPPSIMPEDVKATTPDAAQPVAAPASGWWASQSTGMKAAIIGGAAAVLLGGGYLLMKKKPASAAAAPALKANKRRRACSSCGCKTMRPNAKRCHRCGHARGMRRNGVIMKFGPRKRALSAKQMAKLVNALPKHLRTTKLEDIRQFREHIRGKKHGRKLRSNGGTVTKTLANGWKLTWHETRPNTIYVDDERGGTWSDSALKVGGRVLYDAPERVPQATKSAVVAMFRAVRSGKLRSNGAKMDAFKHHAARAWSWAKPHVKKHSRKAAKAGARGAAWGLRHGAGAMAHLSRKAHSWSMAPNKRRRSAPMLSFR